MFGLIVFVIEGALVLRQGAIGLNVETEGPFAALFAAVRPLLPGLLARVALAYSLGGAALGVAAVVLAGLLLSIGSGRAKWSALFVVEWIAIAAGLVWLRAIERPALFDDLNWFQPILGWLVLHGQPWHPALFAGAWGVGHAVVLLRQPKAPASRIRWSRLIPIAAILGLGVLGLTTLLGRGPIAPLYVLIGVDAFRPDRLAVYGGKGNVAVQLEAFARDATVPTSRRIASAVGPDRRSFASRSRCRRTTDQLRSRNVTGSSSSKSARSSSWRRELQVMDRPPRPAITV